MAKFLFGLISCRGGFRKYHVKCGYQYIVHSPTNALFIKLEKV